MACLDWACSRLTRPGTGPCRCDDKQGVPAILNGLWIIEMFGNPERRTKKRLPELQGIPRTKPGIKRFRV